MNLSNAKALTIWQPYAALLMAGIKQYETRVWNTSYRGPVVITSAARWQPSQRATVEELRRDFPDLDPILSDLQFGMALGVVELKAVHRTDVLYIDSPLEKRVGNFNGDRFAWEMVNHTLFDKPIPVYGRQKLWDWNSVITKLDIPQLARKPQSQASSSGLGSSTSPKSPI